MEACKLDRAFKEKGKKAQQMIVARFIKKVGLSYRVSTHIAQKSFKETELSSQYFVSMARERVNALPPEAVLNMDQTPIWYSYHSGRTLEVKGTRSVNVLSSMTSTQRATLNAAVTMSGDKLMPFTIFKGSRSGKIATKELPTFSSRGLWACQKKAWCDEDLMVFWVKKILVPWAMAQKALHPGIIPLLLLDAYKVHMMGVIVELTQSYGIEVLHIPAGCTYLCQPVDVGINRPLKAKMEELWEEWMLQEGIASNETPSRKLIGEWILEAWDSLDRETVKNAWKKKKYSWWNE